MGYDARMLRLFSALLLFCGHFQTGNPCVSLLSMQMKNTPRSSFGLASTNGPASRQTDRSEKNHPKHGRTGVAGARRNALRPVKSDSTNKVRWPTQLANSNDLILFPHSLSSLCMLSPCHLADSGSQPTVSLTAQSRISGKMSTRLLCFVENALYIS
jgi:hypothetical protein